MGALGGIGGNGSWPGVVALLLPYSLQCYDLENGYQCSSCNVAFGLGLVLPFPGFVDTSGSIEIHISTKVRTLEYGKLGTALGGRRLDTIFKVHGGCCFQHSLSTEVSALRGIRESSRKEPTGM